MTAFLPSVVATAAIKNTRDGYVVLAHAGIVAGGLTLVFLIFALEQITRLSQIGESASHAEREQTAEYHRTYYTTAFHVSVMSTLAFLAAGVGALLRLLDSEADWLHLTAHVGAGLFAYGAACLAVLVVYIALIELSASWRRWRKRRLRLDAQITNG